LKTAESITGTKGSEVIEKGTVISGEQVAKHNGGEQILRLNLTNSEVSDENLIYQILFAVRNENIKFNLSLEPDKEGDLYDYINDGTDNKSTYARNYGRDQKDAVFVDITILGDVKLTLRVGLGMYGGKFMAYNDGDRQTYIGNGKYQRNLDYNYKSNGKKGLNGLNGRVITIMSRKNTNTLRNYLDGSNEKSRYD